MYAKLTIPERLKDLRVVDKHLTLEQLAEQTGLSKSALGKYETDDYKDISPFAIATLADFYGVSTDYLMGLTENKNHPNTELQSLHLSDDMVELLSSGKINNRLLCELASHPNFRRLMIDMEICIDQIANMRVEQMNLVLEATRQTVMSKYAPGEDDLYMRTLEQLAEQTGLSKSALGKYETDDYKDISPFAIATLADFYGVSADYLMGLTDNKEVPNADVQSLHLNDEMIELLRSGKINNRLLCELATHPNFRRLMVDMEICIDQIANMRVEQMNLVMEATRQAVLSKYAPGEDDLYMRTLELGQVQESDYYSHVIHDDLDSIVRDIREAHRKDKTTADPQPTLDDVKEKFEQALEQGSQEEVVIHEFCDRMQIPFEKISSEDFSAFLRILSLSKMLKNPNNMRGKAKPQPYYAPKRKKRR